MKAIDYSVTSVRKHKDLNFTSIQQLQNLLSAKSLPVHQEVRSSLTLYINAYISGDKLSLKSDLILS